MVEAIVEKSSVQPPAEVSLEAIRDALIAREVRMARPVIVAVRAGGDVWRYYVHQRRPNVTAIVHAA